MGNRGASVEVSRRIEAPASKVFEILADPSRHVEFDGSDMLRGAASPGVISGVGDVFSMRMHFEEIGDYVMDNHVVEFVIDRRLAWEPAPGDAVAAEGDTYPIGVPAGHRWSYELRPDGPDATVVIERFECADAPEELREAVRGGDAWIEPMASSLERLEALCCT